MKTEIQIQSKDSVAPALLSKLNKWFQREFGYIPFKWAEPDWYILAQRGRSLTGRVGIVQREVSVKKQVITIAGLSGLIISPGWRGKGIARLVLQRAAVFMKRELGVGFGLLLCRQEVAPLYEKLGWRVVPGPTTFDQPQGKTTHPRLTMVLSLSEKAWPPGAIDLCGLPW